MIRHVAVFRFVPEFTSDQREHWMSSCGRCRSRSRTAEHERRAGCAGRPGLHELAIVADFDDLDGLDAYTRHPAHAEVLRISAP